MNLRRNSLLAELNSFGRQPQLVLAGNVNVKQSDVSGRAVSGQRQGGLAGSVVLVGREDKM
jgi:hypothetical protein